jgi:DNA polymerase III subunit epsilon
VDNTGRELHGARLDARLLAEVYLAMTGGQAALTLEREAESAGPRVEAAVAAGVEEAGPLVVVRASDAEWAAHRQRLAAIAKKAGRALWASDLEAAEAA